MEIFYNMNIVSYKRGGHVARALENPKATIVSTGMALAVKEGLDSINMRKVASEGGVALGTIYNYFPGKADLTYAITNAFWNEAFKTFHHALDPELDFYKQFEVLYFYMRDYLAPLRETWLKDLSSFPDLNLSENDDLEYMAHFLQVLEEIIDGHKGEFNPTIYGILGPKRVMNFILSNFLLMLQKNEHDYRYFNLILKRLLYKNKKTN